MAASLTLNECNDKELRCEQLLQQAVPMLNEMDRVIKEQAVETSDLDKQLQFDASQLTKDKQELGAWYHNPVIIAPVAAMLSILAYSYATRH